MKSQIIHKTLSILIAAVWLVNGLFCKVLNLVPRHEQIVARILGDEYARPLTIVIGISEIIMAVWILTSYKSKLNAISQMVVIATMNTMEFFLVPDLLLWGKLNAAFAVIFIALIFYNEFVLNKNLKLETE
ncbi:putative membrane protein YphA (DoxX/SURF4 family) [Pedobacter sp. UYP30]|uniref:DoxX-like family protein n=1 Tax=Pedobacter sp. UYP30 TaxID=1756400 RepID=UPI003398B235